MQILKIDKIFIPKLFLKDNLDLNQKVTKTDFIFILCL